MVTVLIGQGAQINLADKNGWTALHFARQFSNINNTFNFIFNALLFLIFLLSSLKGHLNGKI